MAKQIAKQTTKNTTKKAYVNWVSPIGIAKWPYLSSSDAGNTEYEPAYRVTLEITQDVADNYMLSNGEPMMAQLMELYDEAVAWGKEEEKTVNSPPWKETEDGNIEMRFKVAAEYKDHKTRTIVDTVLPIVDGKLKPLETEEEIGSGSRIRINFFPFIYDAGGKVGVSLRLKAVQVIDLVPKGGTYGFQVEDFSEETDNDTGFTVF